MTDQEEREYLIKEIYKTVHHLNELIQRGSMLHLQTNLDFIELESIGNRPRVHLSPEVFIYVAP